MDGILLKMENKSCSNEFPTTEELYSVISDDVVSIVFLIIACILAVICVGIFAEELVFLCKINNGSTLMLRKVAIILGLYPVTIFTSVICLLVPRSTLLLDLIASCYLSVCFYTFVTLTIDYFGGEDKMLEVLSQEKVALNTPPCCCCCCCILKPTILSRKKLLCFEMFALQVAVVRPVLLFIAIVLWADGKYKNSLDPTTSFLYISVITAVSTLLSLYGTAVIVRASRQHLQKYSLLMKYWSFNLMLILINLQKLLFAILETAEIPECMETRGTKVRGSALQNALLVIETFLLTFLARKAYRIDKTDKEDTFSPMDLPQEVDTLHNETQTDITLALDSVDESKSSLKESHRCSKKADTSMDTDILRESNNSDSNLLRQERNNDRHFSSNKS